MDGWMNGWIKRLACDGGFRVGGSMERMIGMMTIIMEDRDASKDTKVIECCLEQGST